MNVDHSADCPCKAFGFTCEKVRDMKIEVKEILERADTLSEAIEMAFDLGKTDEQRCMYSHLMGKAIKTEEDEAEEREEAKKQQRRSSRRGGPKINMIDLRDGKLPNNMPQDLKDLINKILGDIRDRGFSGDSDNDG